MISYQKLLNQSANYLKINSISNYFLDSEILLSNVLKISREKLLLNLDKKIDNLKLKSFKLDLELRKKKKPIAYIVGKKEFWKTEFLLNNSVLIPRPDSELIVEETLDNTRSDKIYNILDIGTGSGCIIISVIKERNKSYGIGIDISKEAARIAKTNAKIQQLKNRIKIIHSDIDNFFSNKYDLILSNPPYIKKCICNSLDEGIRNFEPKLALDGGLDGYSIIKKVIKKSSKLIKINGKLILEIGEGQFYKTREILKKNGFYVFKISKDLAGKKRCITSIKI